VAHVVGAGLERDGKQIVLGGGGLGHRDGARFFEHPGHTAGLAHVAVVLAHHVADLADGAVAVVGSDVHEDGNAAGAVAFERELFVDGAGELAGAALDGALDVVRGHVLGFGGEHGGAQTRVGFHVAAAGAGGDGNFLDQAGENLAAFGVGGRLFMLDRGPFTVSRHSSEPSISNGSGGDGFAGARQNRGKTGGEGQGSDLVPGAPAHGAGVAGGAGGGGGIEGAGEVVGDHEVIPYAAVGGGLDAVHHRDQRTDGDFQTGLLPDFAPGSLSGGFPELDQASRDAPETEVRRAGTLDQQYLVPPDHDGADTGEGLGGELAPRHDARSRCRRRYPDRQRRGRRRGPRGRGRSRHAHGEQRRRGWAGFRGHLYPRPPWRSHSCRAIAGW